MAEKELSKLEQVALEIFGAIISRGSDHGALEEHARLSFEFARIWLKVCESEK